MTSRLVTSSCWLEFDRRLTRVRQRVTSHKQLQDDDQPRGPDADPIRSRGTGMLFRAVCVATEILSVTVAVCEAELEAGLVERPARLPSVVG